jgi:hypothetical protein
MLLPDYLGELLGAILAGENLVAHEETIRLYVMLCMKPMREIGRSKAFSSQHSARSVPTFTGCPQGPKTLLWKSFNGTVESGHPLEVRIENPVTSAAEC